jgi:hypothetical protein
MMPAAANLAASRDKGGSNFLIEMVVSALQPWLVSGVIPREDHNFTILFGPVRGRACNASLGPEFSV